MRVFGIICAILLVVAVGFGIWFVSQIFVRHDIMVDKLEDTTGARSLIASAVNNCSAKMATVWEMAREEGMLEKDAQVGVAEARSQVMKAEGAVKGALANPDASVMQLTTLAANYAKSMGGIKVAFEATPDLKMSEVYKEAQRAAQEGFNEIKTAIDDSIVLAKSYNGYRKGLFTSWLVGKRGWEGKFPLEVEYYKGGIENPLEVKITAADIRPQS